MTAVERYLNRSRREVEAVQLTRETYAEVYEWSPGKPFYGPAPKCEPLPITGYTVFTPRGRVKAEYGDWIVRLPSGAFSVWTTVEFLEDHIRPDLGRVAG